MFSSLSHHYKNIALDYLLKNSLVKNMDSYDNRIFISLLIEQAERFKEILELAYVQPESVFYFETEIFIRQYILPVVFNFHSKINELDLVELINNSIEMLTKYLNDTSSHRFVLMEHFETRKTFKIEHMVPGWPDIRVISEPLEFPNKILRITAFQRDH